MLFGTVKGAYTGAENRAGLFEQANGGTMLLDEINSMPLSLQAKLLRVLQEGCIRRLGDTEERRVDVRIISNINIPPQEALRSGGLRQDLFFRLGVVNIAIPPLRERTEDIDLLAKRFIMTFNETMHKSVMDISRETLSLFHQYPWPGNVRELRHAIEHAMNIIPDGKVLIRPEHLPGWMLHHTPSSPAQRTDTASAKPVFPPPSACGETDRDTLIRILREHGGNITNSAAYLGISRQNLQYRLKKFRIDVKQLS